jgi:glycosyltransferase involved in cell wall biosynthesis
MRIAYICSEFSGLPGSGGIGSYFLHAARCMMNAGNDVEVFTSGTSGQLGLEGIRFHHLGESTSPIFAVHAAEAFAARHHESPFDLMESAELKAEGLYAARAVPEVAHVVRVHAPSVILHRYLDLPPTRWQRVTGVFKQARIALGAWRRGLPIPPIYLSTRPPMWFPSLELQEREVAASADLVIVMNEEIRRFVRDYWWIKDEGMILEVPNPYFMPPHVPAPGIAHKSNLVLGFAGRLEPAKGILELIEVLKQVLPRYPDWTVKLAGRSVPSCLSGADVGEMAREQFESFGSRVQFLGPLSKDEMSAFWEGLDLCVFPSLWESFHYVVLEAMAAGKAIVATRTGAVVDMLDEGKAGLLIDPGNVRQLARALDLLMGDPARRQKLGEAARQRFLAKYNEASLTSTIQEAYRLALKRRDRRLKDKIVSGLGVV